MHPALLLWDRAHARRWDEPPLPWPTLAAVAAPWPVAVPAAAVLAWVMREAR